VSRPTARTDVFELECDTGRQGSTTEVGLGGNVVTCLTRDLVGQHYCVYVSRNLGTCAILRLRSAFLESGNCALISRLRTMVVQSQDYTISVRNLEIAQYLWLAQ